MYYWRFMRQIKSWFFAGLVISITVASSGACVLSKKIQLTSDPSGAEAWLANQRVGPTPVLVRVKVTGVLDPYTFDPVFVTVEADGFERAVREVDYSWSLRNTLWSIPLLGIPLLSLGMLPNDTHVVLIPEEP